MAKSRVVWSEEQQRFVPADGGAAPRGAPARKGGEVRPPASDRTQVMARPPVRSGPPPSPRPARTRPTAPPASGPPPAPEAAPRPRRRRRRGRVLLVLGVLALLAVPVLVLAVGWWQFNRIERVAVADVLSPSGGGGTNYLIVGADSREGIDPDDPNASAFIGSEVSGSRTDTIMILRVSGDGNRLLSIPRDLWVTNAVTGEVGRINSTYQTSPAALIQTVQQSLGIPVHHYLEIGFPSFGDLVDAIGGITVVFEHPARDDKSGLYVEQTGPVTLNGEQALAYVRSRTYTELIDGTWVTEPTADIGRTARQRDFLTTLLAEVGATRNPLRLLRVAGALGGGLRIDDALTYWEALRLGWRLKGLSPVSVELPVYGRTTTGGAAVLELDTGATEVLGQFGATSG